MQVKTSSASMLPTKNGKKSKKRFSFKKFFLKFGIVIASFILIGVFLLYGPIEYFRDGRLCENAKTDLKT